MAVVLYIGIRKYHVEIVYFAKLWRELIFFVMYEIASSSLYNIVKLILQRSKNFFVCEAVLQ